MPKLVRPHLQDVIATLARSGRLRRFLLVQTGTSYQASAEREPGAFTIGTKEDPVEALYEALGPRYGESWEDHLAKGAMKVGPIEDDPAEEEDDLSSVI